MLGGWTLVFELSQHAFDKNSGAFFGVASAKNDLFSCHLRAPPKSKIDRNFDDWSLKIRKGFSAAGTYIGLWSDEELDVLGGRSTRYFSQPSIPLLGSHTSLPCYCLKLLTMAQVTTHSSSLVSNTPYRIIHLCLSVLCLLAWVASCEITAYLCHVRVQLEDGWPELRTMFYCGIPASKSAPASFLRWRAGGKVSSTTRMLKIRSKFSDSLLSHRFLFGEIIVRDPSLIE